MGTTSSLYVVKLYLKFFIYCYSLCACYKFYRFYFLCLQDIDHIGYVRQAFEAGSLHYCLKILQCDILKDYDVSHSFLGCINCYNGWVFVKPWPGPLFLFKSIWLYAILNCPYGFMLLPCPFRAQCPVIAVFWGHSYLHLLHLMRSTFRYGCKIYS